MWERTQDILPFTRGAQTAVNGLIGLCSWGNRLEGQVMFFCVTRDSVWRWLSEAALWQWDNKSGGESLYPWQHMFESEHQILLSLSDSQQSSQCESSAVFLWCVGAFQSQKHYFRNAGLKSAWNERLSKQTPVFMKREHKRLTMLWGEFLEQCRWMQFIFFSPVAEQHWDLSLLLTVCREVTDGLTGYKLYNSGVNAIRSLDSNAFIFPRSSYSNWCLALLSVCFTLTESVR